MRFQNESLYVAPGGGGGGELFWTANRCTISERYRRAMLFFSLELSESERLALAAQEKPATAYAALRRRNLSFEWNF